MKDLSGLDLNALRSRVAQLRATISLGRRLSLSLAADMLEHYLDGKGETRQISFEILRLDSHFEAARRKLLDRVSVAIVRNIAELAAEGDGSRRITTVRGEPMVREAIDTIRMSDLYWASGSSTIEGRPDIRIEVRDGKVAVDGRVDVTWYDRYWWNPEEWRKDIPARLGTAFPSFRPLGTKELDELRLAGLAAAFRMESFREWRVTNWSALDRIERILARLGRTKLGQLADDLFDAEELKNPSPQIIIQLFGMDITDIIGWIE